MENREVENHFNCVVWPFLHKLWAFESSNLLKNHIENKEDFEYIKNHIYLQEKDWEK